MNNYLTGTQIPINRDILKSLIGQKVIYLFSRDIDKSGRGYYTPHCGIITAIYRRNIDFDGQQIYQSISALREMVLASDENIKANFGKQQY
jgi:hypothetical protein